MNTSHCLSCDFAPDSERSFKTALIAAHLNAGVILVVTVSVALGIVSHTKQNQAHYKQSSKVVACGHCLVTLSLTINETLKWLTELPILMQGAGRQIIGGTSDRMTILIQPI